MSSILEKNLTPRIIRAITSGVRPALRDELINFLNGRIARIPEGLGEEFANELTTLVQDIGVQAEGGSSAVAGEVVGMIEGGLILGKASEIVDQIETLITSREDEGKRTFARERLQREMSQHPERFLRLETGIDEIKIQRDIEKSLRDRQRSQEKKGEVPTERKIQFEDPPFRSRKDRTPVEDIFEDVDLDDDVEEEEEIEQKQPPPDDDLPVPPFLITPKIKGPRRKPLGDKPEDKPEDKPDEKPEDKPEDKDIISKAIARGLRFKGQVIPRVSFIFPDDTKSYNYVELVRKANANALFQDNIFNTSL